MECYGAGLNRNGQLADTAGNRGRGLHTVTKLALPFDNIVSVAAGSDHVVYILDDGNVFAIGCDEKYQIGIGNGETYSTPHRVLINNGAFVTSAAAGWYYTLYVTQDGDAFYCRSESNKRQVKVAIPAQALYPIKGMKSPGLIDVNGDFYFLTSDPTDSLKRHHLEEPVYDVAICKEFKLALTVSGKVFGTGNVKTTSKYNVPNGCDRDYKPVIDLANIQVQRVFGYHECCAIITNESRLMMFGDNYFGQLGTGNTDDSKEFLPVKGLEGVDVARVDLGQSHTLILCEDGAAYSIGFNEDGQLLLNNDDKKKELAVLIQTIPDQITNIFCGDNFTIVGTGAPLVPFLPMVHFHLDAGNSCTVPSMSSLYNFLQFP